MFGRNFKYFQLSYMGITNILTSLWGFDFFICKIRIIILSAQRSEAYLAWPFACSKYQMYVSGYYHDHQHRHYPTHPYDLCFSFPLKTSFLRLMRIIKCTGSVIKSGTHPDLWYQSDRTLVEDFKMYVQTGISPDGMYV